MNAAFTSAADHFGPGFHLDIVVNNAGYSLSGDTETATEEETHQEMETLFFGTARVTTKALQFMRPGPNQAGDARGGLIFNISSLAGLCGLPGHAYYHAGKFAVEGFTESVAREMHPDWNSNSPFLHPYLTFKDAFVNSFATVNFCIVEPSGVKTNFEGHSKAKTQPHPAYAAEDMPARRLESFVQKGIAAGATAGMLEPSSVAETIYKIASRNECVPLRLPLGLTAWRMGKMKFEGLLQQFDAVKELSAMGQ